MTGSRDFTNRILLILCTIFAFVWISPTLAHAQRLWGDNGTVVYSYDSYSIYPPIIELHSGGHSLIVNNNNNMLPDLTSRYVEARFDESGELVATNRFPSDIVGYGSVPKSIESPDGGLLVSFTGADGITVAKLDEQLDVVWISEIENERGYPYFIEMYEYNDQVIVIYRMLNIEDQYDLLAAWIDMDDGNINSITLEQNSSSYTKCIYRITDNDSLKLVPLSYSMSSELHIYTLAFNDTAFSSTSFEIEGGYSHHDFWYHEDNLVELTFDYHNDAADSLLLKIYDESGDILSYSFLGHYFSSDYRISKSGEYFWNFIQGENYRIILYEISETGVNQLWEGEIENYLFMKTVDSDGNLIAGFQSNDEFRVLRYSNDGRLTWNTIHNRLNGYFSDWGQFNVSHVWQGDTLYCYHTQHDNRFSINTENGDFVAEDFNLLDFNEQYISSLTLTPSVDEQVWLTWISYDRNSENIPAPGERLLNIKSIDAFGEYGHQEELFTVQDSGQYSLFCPSSDGGLWLVGDLMQQLDSNGQPVFDEPIEPPYNDSENLIIHHFRPDIGESPYPMIISATGRGTDMIYVNDQGQRTGAVLDMPRPVDRFYESIQDDSVIVQTWRRGAYADAMVLAAIDLETDDLIFFVDHLRGAIIGMAVDNDQILAVHWYDESLWLRKYSRENGDIIEVIEIASDVNSHYGDRRDPDLLIGIYAEVLFHDEEITLAYLSLANNIWMVERMDFDGEPVTETFPTNYVYSLLPAADEGVWLNRSQYGIILFDANLELADGFERGVDWNLEDNRYYSYTEVIVSPYGELIGAGRDQTNIHLQRLEGLLPSVDVPSEKIIIQPANFELSAAWPNPFNMSTRLTYSIPQTGNITLKVFDVLGREVVNLYSGFKQSGQYNILWNGTNSNGINIASGQYFISLKTGNQQIVRQVVIVR
ncbi:MAG: T9SS type A sorting domain-containing protein [Candidatus Electryonea clarkiae]|nr:T9SS type A sorting domain-containing protein [Candidatus Electryonea clarkiae]MDP8287658.1 T9SS type A sorting domain-containing protein [Candidatus Electryonea clarkiae]